LRASTRAGKLRHVKQLTVWLLTLLSLTAGCGNGDGGSAGGGGGTGLNELERQSSYQLSCMVDTLLLQIPMELSYRLDRPYVAGGSSELTFSAVVTFSEDTAQMLIDAGIDKIDIISAEITASVYDAAPSAVKTSLAAAINDFDLTVDTNDDGTPGPHQLELDPVTVTSTASESAQTVELGLSTSDISMVLGDFEVPDRCLGPTLVGFASEFPVEPAP
jgi:hypothetical protein